MMPKGVLSPKPDVGPLLLFLLVLNESFVLIISLVLFTPQKTMCTCFVLSPSVSKGFGLWKHAAIG